MAILQEKSALEKAEVLLGQLTDSETDVLLDRIFERRKNGRRGISKTPGVCGGRACIEGTRMPVWSLVSHRQMGFTDSEILYSFPTMTPDDLKNAWAYYQMHQAEIDEDIRENNEDEDEEL